VYRRDQPAIARGRFREFYQCDFDMAGQYDTMLADSECLRIVYEILTSLKCGDFEIKVNDRRLLDAMLAACGVDTSLHRTVCSSIDKLDKMSFAEVRTELLAKGVTSESCDAIEKYVTLHGDESLIDRLAADERLVAEVGKVNQERKCDVLDELRSLFRYLRLLGVTHRVALDLSLARGLDYYTALVFEAVLLQAPTTSEPAASQPTKEDTKAKDKKKKKANSTYTLINLDIPIYNANVTASVYLLLMDAVKSYE
jgi:histidyl-tRNA synthetase